MQVNPLVGMAAHPGLFCDDESNKCLYLFLLVAQL